MIKDNKIFSAVRLIKKAYGKYKVQLISLSLLGFISGILEAVGINAVIPLFSLMTGETESITDNISKAIKHVFEILHINFSITPLLIFISLLFIGKFILLLAFKYTQARIIATYENEVRSDLFKKTIGGEWSYLLHQKAGYLEKTIMVDVENGKHLMSYLTEMILLGTSLLIYIIVALSISVEITLITLIVGAILFLSFKKLIYQTKNIAAQEERTMKTVASFINENVYGMKTVKTLVIKEQIINKANSFFDKFKSLQIRRLFLSDINSQSIQLIGMLFIIIVFYVSLKTLDTFNFAAFAVIIYIIQKIFVYIQSAQNKLHNINATIPYLNNVINYQQEIDKHQEKNEGSQKFSFDKNMQLKNVNFQYKENQKVLTNLNLTINKGEMLGLVGPSGAGKTTLVDLLLRVFKPNSGEIDLDGIDISKIDINQWRKNIGYVSQDIFLINDTIENNIKFYDNISEESMIEAAKTAQIYDFIQGLPDKFKTVIGERGLMLSGGQRQRIILTRILAKNPQILILDEATSALDNESELLIQKAIEELKGKITVIAIAHRLSTIMNSDRLLVLENGKITEQGQPQELLKNKNSYFYKVSNIRNNQH